MSTATIGRPEKIATPEQRELIKELASRRVPMKLIARVCDMSENTLKKHHGDLIEAGHAEADASVHKAFFDLCMSGDMKALAMYCKWHLGYKEPPRELHATIDPAILLAELAAADAATFIDPPEVEE